MTGRPLEAADHWARAALLRPVTRDPLAADANVCWFQAGPDNEAERQRFWQMVDTHGCVLLEHLNPAILGLVWSPEGEPAVAYDEDTAWNILRSRTVVSDPAMQETMLAHRREEMLHILRADYGIHTPWFRVGNFSDNGRLFCKNLPKAEQPRR